MKSVLITFDQAYYERIMALLDNLHIMDLETEQLGLRAFVWNIERTI